ncbi:MAG: hypothetical protein PWP24_518, partial [Clostridiales bacterium]|nr:hypothetical protein [Clostridiales bacterium]
MRKRKQMTLLFTLLFCMLGLILAYVLLGKQSNQTKVSEGEDANEIELYSLDTDQTKSLTITNENGTLSLIKKENAWHLTDNESFPVDETNIATMLNTLKKVNASKLVVEDAKDKSEYGLDQPSVIIEITLENGVSAKIELGSKVPVKGGYYGVIDGEKTIYVMDETYYTNFTYKKSDLMLAPLAPSIDAEKITDLKITSGNKTDFEALLNNDATWTILGAYKSNVRGDSSKLSSLFANYSSISYGDCVEYDCKDASAYGIGTDSKKIEIQYMEEDSDRNTSDDSSASTTTSDANETKTVPRQFKLLIGKEDGDGNYYVQAEDSGYVYLMDMDTADELTSVQAFDYVYKYMVSDTVDMLSKLTIETPENKAKITLKETTTKDKDGNNTTSYVCERNGKEMDYDSFSKAYSALRLIDYKGEINPDKILGDDLYATLTIETENGKNVIQLYRYDDNNYYRVSVN